MSKPLNAFGGWLACFYIISWLSLIVLAIFTLLYLLAIFRASNELDGIESLIYCINCGIVAFLSFEIIKLIRIQEPMTPDRVVRLMGWVLILAVLFIIPELCLDHVLTNGKNTAEIGKDVIRVVVWYAIWSLYFKKSKRVLAYYGNKNKKETFSNAIGKLS